MRTGKLLSLTIFKNAKGSSTIDISIVLERLAWALATLLTARDHADSQEGRALRHLGFVALVFTGPKGTEYVRTFEHGHVLRVSDDGRGVIEEGGQGPANIAEALGWTQMVQEYAMWVAATEHAEAEGTRPPVFNNASLLGVPDEIRNWIGNRAHNYLVDWHKRARTEYKSILVGKPDNIKMTDNEYVDANVRALRSFADSIAPAPAGA